MNRHQEPFASQIETISRRGDRDSSSVEIEAHRYGNKLTIQKGYEYWILHGLKFRPFK